MAIDANVLFQQQPVASPLQQIAQAEQVKNALAQRQLMQAQAQSAQQKMAMQQIEAQQSQGVVQALQQNNGDVRKASKQLIAGGNPMGFALEKHADEAEQHVAAFQAAQQKVADHKNELMGNAASSVLEATPALQGPLYQQYRQFAIQNGLATEQQLPPVWNDQAKQVLQFGRDSSISYKDRAKAQSDAANAKVKQQQADTAAQKAPYEIAKLKGEAELTDQKVKGTVPLTPKDILEGQLRSRAEDIAAGNLSVSRSREARQAKNEAPVTDMSEQSIQNIADNFNKSGTLPPRLSKELQAKILNKAGEAGPQDIAANKSDLGALRQSLGNLQKQRDAIGSFEQTASKNIDNFINTASKVVDTGSPLLNAPIRMVMSKVAGSPDQVAYEAARTVAVNEIAKITSNPGLSGALSDHARQEVQNFNPDSATLKQTLAVMKILKQDMENRPKAMDQQIGLIKGNISKIGKKPDAAPAKADLDSLRKKYNY